MIHRYRRLVRKLNYLTITHPDIAFTISVVSQFMEVLMQLHWDASIQIVKFLKRVLLGKGSYMLGIPMLRHSLMLTGLDHRVI